MDLVCVVSVNLNKRLTAVPARRRFVSWLLGIGPEVVVAQEPWREGTVAFPEIPGYAFCGGNHRVCAWGREDVGRLGVSAPAESILRCEVGELAIYGVYLDPYRQRARAKGLEALDRAMGVEDGRAALVLGDFNLAPEAGDGVSNGLPSRFNGEVDRAPFRRLLERRRLMDVGAQMQREWTIERVTGKYRTQFRCDLALVSESLAGRVAMQYDHTVRSSAEAFTDHSALVLRLEPGSTG